MENKYSLLQEYLFLSKNYILLETKGDVGRMEIKEEKFGGIIKKVIIGQKLILVDESEIKEKALAKC